MLPARASLANHTVLAEHMSAHGPRVTHVRGILMANTLGNLRALGLYEAYTREIHPVHFEAIQGALANTWLPVSHAVAHYRACDALNMSEEQLSETGQRQAQRIRDTFLGLTLQRARQLGVDGLKASVKRVGRLHDRIYMGGGCAAIETGPKDLHFELIGFPFAPSRTFRLGWLSYGKALAELFTRVAYVKPTRAREPGAENLALSASWV